MALTIKQNHAGWRVTRENGETSQHRTFAQAMGIAKHAKLMSASENASRTAADNLAKLPQSVPARREP